MAPRSQRLGGLHFLGTVSIAEQICGAHLRSPAPSPAPPQETDPLTDYWAASLAAGTRGAVTDGTSLVRVTRAAGSARWKLCQSDRILGVARPVNSLILVDLAVGGCFGSESWQSHPSSFQLT
jgi:hypothetical protein